jgi:tyrosyl-tRNA synthetase
MTLLIGVLCIFIVGFAWLYMNEVIAHALVQTNLAEERVRRQHAEKAAAEKDREVQTLFAELEKQRDAFQTAARGSSR